MCKYFVIFIAFFVVTIVFVHGEYVTYVRKGNKFEPVMEPVSSTIEPIPIYKLVPKISTDDITAKYERNTLLTVFNTNDENRKLRHFEPEKEKRIVKIEPVN